MKNMEEAMMVVGYSQDDGKQLLNDKNNGGAKSPSPIMDESKMEASEECKQDGKKTDKNNANKGLSVAFNILMFFNGIS